MNEREGFIVHFKCHLETPFHSTEKKYKNLLKCAPYILGSAIRGQLLSDIITNYCTEEKIKSLASLKEEAKILEFHSKCKLLCPINELLWKNKWGMVVSFGQFEFPKYRSITRTAISRASRAASEGSLVNIEQIEDGCNFAFEIVMYSDNKMLGKIKSSLENIGQHFGIGRYKNIGMGRFSIKDVKVTKIKDHVVDKINKFELDKKKYSLAFTTPFVLQYGNAPLDLEENRLASLFSKMLLDRSKELSEFLCLNFDLKPAGINSIKSYIIPDYISRYSLEESSKKNRLVAKESSYFKIYLEKNDDSFPVQLTLCSLFGIGEWADIGFGRFENQLER